MACSVKTSLYTSLWRASWCRFLKYFCSAPPRITWPSWYATCWRRETPSSRTDCGSRQPGSSPRVWMCRSTLNQRRSRSLKLCRRACLSTELLPTTAWWGAFYSSMCKHAFYCATEHFRLLYKGQSSRQTEVI